MKKFWQDFKKFISRGNVVDMAVGVAVATAFTAIVTAFTKGFITPLLALLTNNSDLSEMKWVIRQPQLDAATGAVLVEEVALLWGAFVQKIIDFIIIAFTLFLVMKIASSVAAHSAKIRERMVNALTDADEKAAELEAQKKLEEQEAKKKAEEEEAKKLAEIEKEKMLKEHKEEREEKELELLKEIRDLLKKNA